MSIPKCMLFIAVVLSCSAARIKQDQTKKKSICDAPEYFGICDTFVPGTFIGGRDRQPMNVSNTWPGGPADRAGICAGDQILSVNDLHASENTWSRMLREFVSDTPNSVLLRVLRGNEELEFMVPRVRESTLAYLSNQKFVRRQLVPLAQTNEGMDEFERFRDRVMAAVGYKRAGMEWVPLKTPDAQVQRFVELLESINNSERISSAGFSSDTTRIFEKREGCSTGFSAIVLKAPDEVWVRTVLAGSPADKAGLLSGDQLIAINGKVVKGMKKEEVESLLLQPDVPRPIKLAFRRSGRVSNIVIKTEKFQDFEPHTSFPQTLPNKQPSAGSDLIVGLSVLHAENPNEAIVQSIAYPSPAFDANLLMGDKILLVNGSSVGSLSRDQLDQILSPVKSDEIVLEINRLGKQLTFRIVPTTYDNALAKIGRKLTRFGPAPYHCSEQQK